MAELSNSRTSNTIVVDDDGDGGLIIPKIEEMQIMDFISCTIEDEDQNSVTGDCALGGGSAHVPTIQEVLDKMKLMEAQVAACLETQPLLYQVFAKCNKLEQRLKVMQKKVDRRFADLAKGPDGHGFPIPNFALTGLTSTYDASSGSRLSRKNQPPKKRRRQQTSVQTREQNISDGEVDLGQDFDHNGSDSDWQPGADNDDIDVQHDEDDVDVEASESSEEDVGSSSLLNTYRCKVCPIQVGFKTPEGLAKHYTKHHPITETGTDGTNTNLDSKPAKKRRVTKLSTRRKPDQSSSEGSEALTYTCPKPGCHKSFPHSWRLERHQMSVHQVIECYICQEEFIRKTDLRAHKISVHPGDAFPCPEGCGKVFRTDGSLTVHLSTCRRGPQPPQKCDECGKTLKNAKTLQHHKQLVHQGLHRVVCSICGKAIGIDGLKHHMRTHEDGGQRRTHFCETCAKGFITVQDLDNHRRTHTGERPFTCEDCGKTFASGSTLRGHRLIHTGKPHVCDLCGWSFAKRAAMVRHKAAHGRGTAKEGSHKGARRSLIVGHDDATGAVITKPATPASQNQDQQIGKSVQIE